MNGFTPRIGRTVPALLAVLATLLACGGGGGSSAPPPAAAFTFAPAAPSAGEAVQFTDASTGVPTSWAWSFGDGGASTLRNPTHTYASAGTYTVTLTASGAPGAGAAASRAVTVGAPASTFDGDVILGCPTATSIRASVFTPDQAGTVHLAYGTASGTYPGQTPDVAIQAGTPVVVDLAGLQPDTRYHYRLRFKAAGASAFGQGAERTFRTARPAGSTFTFTLQADSHLDANTSLATYLATLANIAGEAPDFHIDLGDTFMCEKHSAPFTDVLQTAPDWATVEARYRYERPHFGLIGAPLFLVNGNHEGEAGWMARSASGEDLSVWATLARQKYFVNPLPGAFYQGDATAFPFVGERGAYYAWTWGDALFVVLDPYWASTAQPGADAWNLTLGKAQYDWLATVLAASSAPFKFVFIHNLVGGLQGQMRGGAEAAPFFEWGGGDNQASPATFAAKRPGWAMPIHALLAKHGVTAVFHGHDHLYAHQVLDGIHYQEVPQPSALNAQSGPNLAAAYGYASGTILSSSGHLMVTVGPLGATCAYVRTWANPTGSQVNGHIDDSWTAAAPAGATGAAGFTFSPQPPVSGTAVTFTDTSTGTPSAWAWDFGDGTAGTAKNPAHTYAPAATTTYAVTLTATYPGGTSVSRQAVTVAGAAPAAKAAFVFGPLVPAAGGAVAFQDTSTGGPTAWAWDFGDGTASRDRNPAHAFAAAGTYPVTLTATFGDGTRTATRTLTVVRASAAATFGGTVVLGCPTAAAIVANVHSPDQGGAVWLGYAPAAGGSAEQRTATFQLQAGRPLEIPVTGLAPDTAYAYRLYFQAAGAGSAAQGPDAAFHTARAPGSTFTFCVQGDSHPERANLMFDPALYRVTLATAALDRPDFFVALGDDFSIDQINQADPAAVTADQVEARYALQRPYLGLVGASSPVFLVNGNHEQAARYLLDGTADNPAVWAQNARNAWYSQPAPDAFYSGNEETVPNVGLLRNTFAFTWGDALFVVLDPYWASPVCVDNPFYGGTKRSDLWTITHGDAQYQWLKSVLSGSRAKYKFVFAHHVLGTGRGGVEEAPTYEWGGFDGNGTYAFPARRPGWSAPIHKLMADAKVTVFFQGHDHVWVRQALDGVTYQTLPNPADPKYALFNADAFLTGDTFGNTGYARVTVGPAGVKVDYVRTFLPGDGVTGTVASSYTLAAP